MGLQLNGNGKIKVTLKDLAKATNFTINTVSRALKDKGDISEATKKLIQEKAKEMGYIPNTIAGSLRSGLTKTIAIILGDISNPYFAIMVKDIEAAARKQQYNTFVINTDEKYNAEEKAIYSALSKNVDGIILFPVQKNDNDIKALQKCGVPFVLIGRHFKDNNIDYVISDDVKGGYLATEHLISKGHKKILMINGPQYISCANERLKGYQNALSDNDIEISTCLTKEITIISGHCKTLINEVLKNKLEFSAIFAFNDMIAWEAIYTLQENGIRIPEDIAVVGYDNIQSKLFFSFPLTTINISKGKMACKAVEILLKKISSGDQLKYYNEVFDTHLIVRKST